MTCRAYLYLALTLLFGTAGCAPLVEPTESKDSGGSYFCQGHPEFSLGETAQLTVMVSESMTSKPYVDWAVKSGCFEAWGLEVDLLSTSSDVFTKTAALSGQTVDIASDGLLEVLGLSLSKDFQDRLTLVANGYGYSADELEEAHRLSSTSGALPMDTALIVKTDSDITRLGDLRGRTLGISTGGNSFLGLQVALEQAGLDVVELGIYNMGSAERLAAYQRGDLDAVVVSGAPLLQEIRENSRVLVYPGAYVYQPGPAIVFYTSANTYIEKREAIGRFQMALIDMEQSFALNTTLTAFRDFLVDEYEADPDSIEDFAFPVFSQLPPSPASLQHYVSLLKELRGLDLGASWSGISLNYQPREENYVDE